LDIERRVVFAAECACNQAIAEHPRESVDRLEFTRLLLPDKDANVRQANPDGSLTK